MRHIHYFAFDQGFFQKHQRTLLWLLNAPMVRTWFRWVMRIRRFDCADHERIVEIQPDHYKVFIRETARRIYLRADFRTHPKFARRHYYAFRPLWWAMHLWDFLIADRFLPALSFGFATLTAYPDPGTGGPTGSATVERSTTSESIATIRAGAGTYVSSTDNPNNIAGFQTATASSPNLRALDRAHFTFPTSGLGASVEISDAVLSIHGAAKNDDGTPVTPNINIYDATPAANFNFITSDYGQIGTTAQCDTPITYAGWATAGYNAFTLNATGRGNISKTGVTKFGTRNANYDVANVAPSYSSNTGHFLQAYLANETGTTKDPKLVVTYSLAKILTEAVSVVDTLTRLPARSLLEALTITDTLRKLPARVLSDSLSIADTVLRTLQRALTEALPITDTETNLKIKFHESSEAITVSDAVTKRPARQLTDPFSITDLLNRVSGRPLSESISITDLFGKVYGRVLTETISIVESIRRFLNNLDARYSRKFPSKPGSYSAKYTEKGPTYKKKYPDP